MADVQKKWVGDERFERNLLVSLHFDETLRLAMKRVEGIPAFASSKRSFETRSVATGLISYGTSVADVVASAAVTPRADRTVANIDMFELPDDKITMRGVRVAQ